MNTFEKRIWGRLPFSVHRPHNNLTLPLWFRTRPIRGLLGRLGKVLLVRIVKNVVVYSNAIHWEVLTTFIGGRLQVNDKRKVFPYLLRTGPHHFLYVK